MTVECPKCRKPVGDNDIVCANCGVELRPGKKTALARRMRRKDKPAIEMDSGIRAKRSGRLGDGKLKLGLFFIAFALLVTLIILIVVNVVGSEGENTAEDIAEYIGMDVGNAQKKLDMHFKDESAFQGVNNALKFNYIVESEDSVKLDGITYPEWAALITVDGKERIESVKYACFEALKDNTDGEEKSKAINLNKFEKGTKWGTVSDETDLDYYSISWTKDTKAYVYRYWYENDAGDRQPVVLSTVFDTDNKFLYYTSTLVYPEYL